MNAARSIQIRNVCGSAKYVLLAVLAALIGAGFYFGRDAWGLWQFKVAIEEEAALAKTRGGLKMQDMAEACASCHGFDGASLSQDYPQLAGQPSGYIAAQLKQFASGQRRNPIMGPLAAALSDEQIHQYANYFANSKPRAIEPVDISPAERTRGAELARSCAACHGANLEGGNMAAAGDLAYAPRLRGQARNYMLRQLKAFQSGERGNTSSPMYGVVKEMSDADMLTLVKHLSML